MMTTYSPGPWTVARPNGTLVLDAHGDAVARVDRLKLFGPAHARLIAAAPDLLAALQAAIPGLETLADADRAGWQPHLIAARAAIAKAKGDLS